MKLFFIVSLTLNFVLYVRLLEETRVSNYRNAYIEFLKKKYKNQERELKEITDNIKIKQELVLEE